MLIRFCDYVCVASTCLDAACAKAQGDTPVPKIGQHLAHVFGNFARCGPDAHVTKSEESAFARLNERMEQRNMRL